MTHLVLGSKGFLGRHLLAALPCAAGADLPECDVRETDRECGYTRTAYCHVGNAKAENGVGAVWHLAALNGSTAGFYEQPWEVLDTQVRGTLNVIDACVEENIQTLVLFSSSEAYQVPPVIPTPENVPLSVPDLTNPRYSYGGGKIAAELLAWWSPIPRVVIVRPHNVFGPGQRSGHVIPDMIERAAKTPDAGTFDINGSATRSFIYIDDFTDAMMTIWEHTQKQEGRVREIYHVGTEEQTSTVALAGQISDLMGKKGPQYPRGYAYKFKTNPGPEGGTRSRCPDTGKLRALGWSQKVSLEEGLKKTIAAYLEKREEWPG